MHHLQWRRVVFRPPIFWSLVAIELMLFAATVHSATARVYQSPHGMSAMDISEAPDQLATEEIDTDSEIVPRPAVPMAADALVDSPTDDTESPPPGALEWKRTYSDYKLICYAGGLTNDEYVVSRLEIWQRKTLVYSTENYSFTPPEDEVAKSTEDAEWMEHLPPPGSDITGRGIPDVVIAEFSGGAHCCSTYRIFELGDTFREVAVIEAAHGGIEFADLDINGIPVIKMQDWSYAYEFTSFADSPAPGVILRFEKDHYVLAPDLMATPNPTEDELTAKAEEIKDAYQTSNEDGSITVSSPAEWGAGGGVLWREMLELIYTGHEEAALTLFQMAWPAGVRGQRRALRNFAKTVANSPYWQEMVEIGSTTE